MNVPTRLFPLASFVLLAVTGNARALAVGVRAPGVQGACAQRATLIEVPSDTRRTLSYAGRYAIDVDFAAGVALSADQIEDASTFELVVAASGKTTEIKRATWRGFPTFDEASGDSVYSRASLWGKFVPAAGYLLTVRCPNGNSNKLSVSVGSGVPPPAKFSFLVHLLDRTLLTFEAAKVEGTDAVGFDYGLQFAFGTWGRTQTLRLALESTGVFSTDPEDLKIQSALTFGLPLDYRFHPRIRLPYHGEKREFTYPIGVRFKPAELEAEQTFDIVNYTVKAQLAAAIPVILDLPVLWLNDATGVNRPFFPPLLITGFTYVDNIEGSGLAVDDNRWDIEALWRFPIANPIDVRTDWRGFVFLGDGEFEHYLNLGIIYYFSDGHDHGIEVGYQTGSLPPRFEDTSAMSLGFKVDFF